jgi:two-component system chemotaxis response regulator CheY
MTLEQEGFETTLADDGSQGLEVLDAMPTPPDAIITDINMPRLDGFGFIREVREQSKYKGIPILVLTTESAKELRLKARDAGATGWIVKPFDPTRLIGALKTVTGTA